MINVAAESYLEPDDLPLWRDNKNIKLDLPEDFVAKLQDWNSDYRNVNIAAFVVKGRKLAQELSLLVNEPVQYFDEALNQWYGV